MKPCIPLLALLFVLAAPGRAGASATHECGTTTVSRLAFRWCIDRPEKPSGEILWFFHSVFHDEQAWLTHADNRDIRQAWEEAGRAQPTAISVSMGSFWLLTEANGSYPAFRRVLLPLLEERAGGLRGRRLLLGYSMGGFNASQLLFRDPDLFQRVALLSPAFLPVGPFSSAAEVQAFTQRHAAYISRFKVGVFLNLLRGEFRTPQAWEAHDPLQLAARGVARGLPVYVSAGAEDNYGFFEGADTFVRAARSRGSAIFWDPQAGGHRSTNPGAVARFLAQP